MKRRSLELVVALIALLAALFTAPAQAGIFRAYLSLSGNDANPCTLPLPCRLLPAALNAANDGGEVWMLDSANYNGGPVLINKGIKILAIPGEVGSVVGNGGDALIINAPGKDVTLRNLVVLNLAGGMIGVNIQEAAAVHIEKTTVHDFSDEFGGCIRLASSNPVRVFIVDSYLRHCRAAIAATVPVLLANRSSIVVDNTRIERGFVNTAVPAVGVLQQGCVDVALRNSSISRYDVGIQVDTLVADCPAHLQLNQSQLTRNTTALSVSALPVSAQFQASIVASQITVQNDAIVVNNAGNTSSLTVSIIDSNIAYCGNNCVTLTNTATDNVQGIQVNVERSHLGSGANSVLELNAPNGSRVRAYVRDSTIANSTGKLIRTTGAGTGSVQLSLIRSNITSATYGIDHGFGSVRLDGCHITNLSNSFVNNGSSDITSLGNNWLSNVNNSSGFTYITPLIISPI